jgi:hypothetical protein
MNMNVSKGATATAVPTKTPALAGPSKDPAFRAIDRHRTVVEEIERKGGDVSKRDGDRYDLATCTLLATRPTTAPGLFAMLAYVRESRDVYGALDGNGHMVMQLLGSIYASCAALVLAKVAKFPPSAIMVCPDPVLAAIAEHRWLREALTCTCDKLDGAEIRAQKKCGPCPGATRARRAWDRKAGTTALRSARDRALEAERKASFRLAKLRPQTPAGAAALLAYVKADMNVSPDDWHEIAIETVANALTRESHIFCAIAA